MENDAGRGQVTRRRFVRGSLAAAAGACVFVRKAAAQELRAGSLRVEEGVYTGMPPSPGEDLLPYYPFTCIGRVVAGFHEDSGYGLGIGTGALVGPRHVLTNAHVWEGAVEQHAEANRRESVIGFRTMYFHNPFHAERVGEKRRESIVDARVIAAWVSPEWTEAKRRGNEDWLGDYAVLLLDRDMEHWFGVCRHLRTGARVALTGYPGAVPRVARKAYGIQYHVGLTVDDLPEGGRGWRSFSTLYGPDARPMWYAAGASGSPIWWERCPRPPAGHANHRHAWIVGVLAAGGPNYELVKGPRMTDALVQWIEEIKQVRTAP